MSRLNLMAGLALISCATAPHSVLTENPHAYYPHESKSELSKKIKSDLIYKGFDSKGSDENRLAFEKHRAEVGSALAYDSKYDPRTKERIDFSLADSASGTQVTATYTIVTDPGSPLEKTSDLSLTETGKGIQTYLDDLRMEFEMDTLGRIGVMLDSGGRIMGITSKSGASEAGLLAGDSIVSIDAHPIEIGNPTAISRAIAGPPGSKVEIEFRRDGETQKASIVRKKL